MSTKLTKEEKQEKTIIVKSTQKPRVKNALSTPFNSSWPIISETQQSELIDSISSTISQLIQQHVQTLSTEQRKKKKFSPIKLFPSIILGMNKITRLLEQQSSKEGLELVVLCCGKKDVNTTPLIMIQHLPLLCKLKGVDICVMPNSSVEFGKIFGLHSVLVMAFKKQDSGPLNPIINRIKSVTPPNNIPWLDAQPKLPTLLPLQIQQQHQKRDNTGKVSRKPSSGWKEQSKKGK